MSGDLEYKASKDMQKNALIDGGIQEAQQVCSLIYTCFNPNNSSLT